MVAIIFCSNFTQHFKNEFRQTKCFMFLLLPEFIENLKKKI